VTTRKKKLPVTDEGGGLAPDARVLLEQLRIHQVELEVQNEELRVSRRELESALEDYTQLFDFAPIGYLAINGEGTIQRLNLSGARLLGLPRARLVGSRIGTFIAPTERLRFSKFLEAAAVSARGDPTSASTSCEVELEAEDDKARRFVRVSASRLAAQEGEAAATLLALEDITERKRAEQLQRESDERFRALIQNIESAVALVDDRGAFVVVNPLFRQMFDIPDGADILNVNSRDWAKWQVYDEHGALLPLDEHPVRKAVLTRRAVRNQLVALRSPSAKGLRWLLISAAPFLDASGAVSRVVCTYHDLTARRAAEEGLRTSEERLRAMVLASSDAVYQMGPDWSEMRLLRGRDFIASTEEPSRTWLQKYIHPEDQPRVRAAIEEAIRTKSTFELEHRVLRRDGTLGWTFSRAVPLLDSQGEIVEWFGAASDITARKRAEEALRESEERFRVAQELSPVGFAILRPIRGSNGRVVDFSYVYENATIARLNGTEPREVVGRRVLDLFPSHAETPFYKAYVQVVETGQPCVVEAPYRVGAMAEEKWRRVVVARTSGDDIAIMGEDTTDRKRAEEALRESEARFRSVLESSRDALYRYNCRTDRYEYVSPSSEALTGIPADEFLSMGVEAALARVHPDDVPSVRAGVARCLETGEVELEYRQRDRSGEYRWVSNRMSLTRDSDGRPLYRDADLRDITGRKRAEERLAADVAALTRMHALSGRMLDTAGIEPMLQEIMDVAVAVMAADKGTLQLLEEGGLRIAAQCGHERPFLDFFARAENVASVCGEATRRGERVMVPDVEASPLFAGTRSLPLLRAAGVRSVQSTPLRTREGRLLGILTTHWSEPHVPGEHDFWRLDLLARQAADLIQQKQAEKAQREADRRKDEFLAMLSHELRNPLAPIRTSIYLLERVDPNGDQAKRARDVLRRQGEHLTRLVDDLLDVTRITRGKIALQRARIDLREAVASAAEDFRTRFMECGVAFHVLLPEAGVSASADPTRLNQVIANLLHNASKYTRRGDEVELSLRLDGETAEIRVRDSGSGIDPALLAHLFEPFVQGDHSLARSEGGLGLGLALVKAIVELHGGSVRAESPGKGKGAEFVIRLPGAEAAGAPENVAAGPPALGAGHRVLVVEDSRDTADTLAEILHMHGHEVDVVTDGPTALEKFRSSPPDVVLCDIGLPGMDGYEVARAMRAMAKGVKLVALSGYAHPDDVKRAKEAGFDAHVAKPPDPAEIARLLE